MIWHSWHNEKNDDYVKHEKKTICWKLKFDTSTK